MSKVFLGGFLVGQLYDTLSFDGRPLSCCIMLWFTFVQIFYQIIGTKVLDQQTFITIQKYSGWNTKINNVLYEHSKNPREMLKYQKTSWSHYRYVLLLLFYVIILNFCNKVKLTICYPQYVIGRHRRLITSKEVVGERWMTPSDIVGRDWTWLDVRWRPVMHLEFFEFFLFFVL